MATVVTTLTSQEVASKIGVADPPAFTHLEATAKTKLTAALPAYNVTKVEVTTVGTTALKFTITYTPKALDANKAKAVLRA